MQGTKPKLLLSGVNPLRLLCDFLSVDSPARRSDLIFVLAGLPERKRFALKLFGEGLADRIILSVGRYEVRQAAPLFAGGAELQQLARETAPQQRHFFVDFRGPSCHITVAPLTRRGTHPELVALASYLASTAVQSLTIVSTSIHLRRVRFCCHHIPYFSGIEIAYLAVPEEISSFQRANWWRRYRDTRYLISEYVKLAAYSVRYGVGNCDRSLARQLPPE